MTMIRKAFGKRARGEEGEVGNVRVSMVGEARVR